jgi:beta-galactosidase
MNQKPLQPAQALFSAPLRLCGQFLLLLLTTHLAFAQDLKLGGLQGTKQILLSPSKQENMRVSDKTVESPEAQTLFGFRPTEKAAEFYPNYRQYSWFALLNVPFKGRTINLFSYDSWTATDIKGLKTSGRRRNFEEDITGKIASNCYHVAFQRKQVVENEVFMLLVSPTKQRVRVQLRPEQFGVNRVLEYDMAENEAKFVHIVIPPKEYTNAVWKPLPSSRVEIPLKTGWKFAFTKDTNDFKGVEPPKFNDASWEAVSVPHTWNAHDSFDERGIKDSIDVSEMYKRGLGWYRTTFTVPSAYKNKYIKINFLGANQTADVWLNGKYLGKHKGGYTDFHWAVHAFDAKEEGLKQFVNFDKPNVLAVRVDNRYDYDVAPHTADYNFQGGLYRDVHVLIWEQHFVKTPKIHTPSVSPTQAMVSVTAVLRSKAGSAKMLRLQTNILNPLGEIVHTAHENLSLASSEQKNVVHPLITLNQPYLWSPETPHLYTAQFTLFDSTGKFIDQNSWKFGVRSYRFHADSGFALNGKTVKLRGVNVHQDFYGKGWAVDSARKREDFVLIKQMGANYVRLSHYPHHPYILDLCDSLGLIVWAEIPVVNTIGREAFLSNAKKQMKEMITRDYNHPSIVVWGVGNEYYRNFFNSDDTEWALKITKEVEKTAKELDPTRPTIQAQNDLADDRIMGLTDVQGRNRYFGWYEGKYSDIGHELEREHSKYPTWKLLVSEYGAEGKLDYYTANPAIFDHSESYQIDFHKAYWNAIEASPFVAGGTLWNMFDFASFAKIGNMPHINKKGMMTFDRKPKGVYRYYQSQWLRGVQDKPMAYIHANWNGRRGFTTASTQASIEVFSNGDEVELFTGETSLGKKSRKQGFVWSVAIAEGWTTLKAVAAKHGETAWDALEIWAVRGMEQSSAKSQDAQRNTDEK